MEELELVSNESKIPSWIKNVTRWWTEGQINDSEFANGMKYLLQHQIIELPKTTYHYKVLKVPIWVKEISKWWSQDQASDIYFTSVARGIVDGMV